MKPPNTFYKSIISDSLIYGLGTIATRGFNLIALPLFARLLGRQEFAILDIVYMYGMFAATLIGLQITQALMRFWYEEKDSSNKMKMASIGFWTTVITGATVLLICLIFGNLISTAIFGDENYSSIVRASGVYYFVFNLFNFFLIFARLERRPWVFVVGSVTNVALNLIFGLVALVHMEAGIYGLVIAFIVSSLCSACLLAFFFGKHCTSKPKLYENLFLFKFSLPMVPMGLAAWLTMQSGRLVYQNFTTLDDYAIYAFALRIASLPLVLFAGIQLALGPLIYQNIKQKDTALQVSKLLGHLILVLTFVLSAMSIFSLELVDLLGGNQFITAAPLVAPLALTTILLNLYIFNPGFGVAKRTDLQLYFFTAFGLISMVAFYLGTNILGLIGLIMMQLCVAFVFILSWFKLNGIFFPVKIKFISSVLIPISIIALSYFGETIVGTTPWNLHSFILKVALMLGVSIICSSIAYYIHTKEVQQKIQ